MLSPSVSYPGGIVAGVISPLHAKTNVDGTGNAGEAEPVEPGEGEDHPLNTTRTHIGTQTTTSTVRETSTYTAAYLTNHGGGGALVSRTLTDAERRCGALSNGIDGRGAESWPKVAQGTRLFHDLLADVPIQQQPTGQVQVDDQKIQTDATIEEAESTLVERLFALLMYVFTSLVRSFHLP